MVGTISKHGRDVVISFDDYAVARKAFEALVPILAQHASAPEATLPPVAPPPTLDVMADTLRAVIREYEENVCMHEETHRGGFIWTICDQCGAKWADDEGGFKPYTEPQSITRARELIQCVEAPTPKEPPPGLLMSMALRYDHGLGMPGYYDQAMFQGPHQPTHRQRVEGAVTTMRQLWEEVTGNGFYKPTLEDAYAAQYRRLTQEQDSGDQ